MGKKRNKSYERVKIMMAVPFSPILVDLKNRRSFSHEHLVS